MTRVIGRLGKAGCASAPLAMNGAAARPATTRRRQSGTIFLSRFSVATLIQNGGVA
jgi:hypothetical protein